MTRRTLPHNVSFMRLPLQYFSPKASMVEF